jgi:hypothetical protein
MRVVVKPLVKDKLAFFTQVKGYSPGLSTAIAETGKM